MSYFRTALLATGFTLSATLTYHSFCEYRALAADRQAVLDTSSLEQRADVDSGYLRREKLIEDRSSTAKMLMGMGVCCSLALGASVVSRLREQRKYYHL